MKRSIGCKEKKTISQDMFFKNYDSLYKLRVMGHLYIRYGECTFSTKL